jgi:hypothetical protein
VKHQPFGEVEEEGSASGAFSPDLDGATVMNVAFRQRKATPGQPMQIRELAKML